MNALNQESQLSIAQKHANLGQNLQFLEICDSLANVAPPNYSLLIKISALYLAYGFPSYARNCLFQALKIDPTDLQALLNLAHAYLQLGCVNQCQSIYQELLYCYPNNDLVLRNLLFFSEYLSTSSNQDRLELARKWGRLTIENIGGAHERPSLSPFLGRRIKIGYVSADFCQHTVGLLISKVLANHNKNQFEIHCYSSGSQIDAITESIRKYSHFQNVSHLSNAELANQIRLDGIDILIDLSGHTGGSRLTVFAHRPAPLQLSWLGYYATTGLEYIDAVLFDRWHIYEGIEDQFCESIVPLSAGRWCYSPLFEPFPPVMPAPFIKNGFITFGSFNNTLKYNSEVYKVWGGILQSVPNSKLILKWRTFNDPEFTHHVLDQFKFFGVDQNRLEFRGPSPHLEMLMQYQDIDIALDPFPFSGGITSCEALFMGVPVITLPQDRAVSRQTYAFLSSIGRSELSTQNEISYVQKAIELANHPDMLIQYRNSLREVMRESPLMQVEKFTQSLEATYTELLIRISN